MSVLARRSSPRCLGDEDISEYVDRTLLARELLHWDRHLVSCGSCRDAVAGERRMMAALRGAEPALPRELYAALLSLAARTSDAPGPRQQGPHQLTPGRFQEQHSWHRLDTAAAPVHPTGHVEPVRVLSPAAPPCHRSALRAAVFATLAASASAAAAWSLALTGAAPAGPAQQVLPPAGLPGHPAERRHSHPGTTLNQAAFLAPTPVSLVGAAAAGRSAGASVAGSAGASVAPARAHGSR